MNKTVQDLKMGIEAIKQTQAEGILEMENLGEQIGTIDTSITKEYNRWKRDSQAQKV